MVWWTNHIIQPPPPFKDTSLTTRTYLEGWFQEFLQLLDQWESKLDHMGVCLLADNVVLQYGQNPEVAGKENVKQFFADQFKNLKSVQGVMFYTGYEPPNVAFQRQFRTYVVKGDDREIEINVMMMVWFKAIELHDLLRGCHQQLLAERIEMYLDDSAVKARMREKGFA